MPPCRETAREKVNPLPESKIDPVALKLAKFIDKNNRIHVLPLLPASQVYPHDRPHLASPGHKKHKPQKVCFANPEDINTSFVIGDQTLTASPFGPGRPVIPLKP